MSILTATTSTSTTTTTGKIVTKVTYNFPNFNAGWIEASKQF